jgi:hypothetical protein
VITDPTVVVRERRNRDACGGDLDAEALIIGPPPRKSSGAAPSEMPDASWSLTSGRNVSGEAAPGIMSGVAVLAGGRMSSRL